MTYLFWFCAFCLLHTYLLYPILLWALSRGKQLDYQSYSADKLPSISILIPAHNEESVIEEKLQSILKSNYPQEKIQVIIGSDCSTDRTNEIIKNSQSSFSNLQLIEFTERTGKIGIINQLGELVRGEIIVQTDANVFFEENCLFELVKYFKDPEIGLVGVKFVNQLAREDGVSIQENAYIRVENFLKYAEGLIWGTTMGASGGAYALRSELLTKVPSNYIVDDFYISMKVLQQKFKAITNLQAIVYEDVSNDAAQEFTRKVRISTGNYQNLSSFYNLLIPRFNGLAFSYLSHKILRWIGPFLLIFMYLCLVYLAIANYFYGLLLLSMTAMILLVLVDGFFKKINLHLKPLRFISHFSWMNLALLIGFFKFIKGVKTNVWKPTKRSSK